MVQTINLNPDAMNRPSGIYRGVTVTSLPRGLKEGSIGQDVSRVDITTRRDTSGGPLGIRPLRPLGLTVCHLPNILTVFHDDRGPDTCPTTETEVPMSPTSNLPVTQTTRVPSFLLRLHREPPRLFGPTPGLRTNLKVGHTSRVTV